MHARQVIISEEVVTGNQPMPTKGNCQPISTRVCVQDVKRFVCQHLGLWDLMWGLPYVPTSSPAIRVGGRVTHTFLQCDSDTIAASKNDPFHTNGSPKAPKHDMRA